jgi:hypothetical protein
LLYDRELRGCAGRVRCVGGIGETDDPEGTGASEEINERNGGEMNRLSLRCFLHGIMFKWTECVTLVEVESKMACPSLSNYSEGFVTKGWPRKK